MSAAPERRQDRRGPLRVRFSVAERESKFRGTGAARHRVPRPPMAGVRWAARLHRTGAIKIFFAERRPQVPPVLVYCIGAIAFLATFPTKQKLCIGSSWCISLSPVVTLVTNPSYVKYELQTLPVAAKDVTDGDTITVYVNMADHPKSIYLLPEVQEASIQRAKISEAKNFQKADRVPNKGDEHILVKKYRIRLSGIDAPERSMPFGKEAKEELARLVQGKSLQVRVYDIDLYGRLIGDVDCDGVFAQEYMLKKGLAWHYTAYDHRIELNQWENQAKTTRTGLWASSKPENPWEWRKQKRIRAV